MTTAQAPIDSPFGYRSTALQVIDGIDLHGKTAFVTGGYSGLGTEIVRALAAAGGRVLVGARRPDKAAEDLQGIGGTVEILALDLSDPASIDAWTMLGTIPRPASTSDARSTRPIRGARASSVVMVVVVVREGIVMPASCPHEPVACPDLSTGD